MAIELKLEKKANKDVRALLNNTILGTPGGIQYKQSNIGEKIDQLEDTQFLCLNLRGRTIGTIALSRRIFEHENFHPIATDYIRYLSIKSLMRDEKAHKSKKQNKAQKNNRTRNLVSSFFSDLSAIKGTDIPSSSDYLMYAFVESHNERSANLVEKNGFKPYRKFKTNAYNNFLAKKQKGVKRLESSEYKEQVKNYLYKEYNEHSLYHPKLINLKKDYWILEENGQLIAGIKVRLTSWKILNLPGVHGKFLLKILPKFSFLKKFLDPENFNFLACEGIIIRDGHEQKLTKLLEGVCYEHKTSIAMFWFDTESPLLNRINQIKKMGILKRILNFKPARLYIRSENLNPKTEKMLRDRPTYISAYDIV
jgi:hypothetical protein